MHDLNTINRLNAEAFAKAIHNFRTQGRVVLARYEGSTLMSIETFETLQDAQLTLDLAPAIAAQGERAVIYMPLPAFHAAQRDQSEDKTLGDYVTRKLEALAGDDTQ